MKDNLIEFFKKENIEKIFLKRISDRLTFCFRCGEIWARKRREKMPFACPRCNSPYYNKPRQKDIKKLMLTKKIEF